MGLSNQAGRLASHDSLAAGQACYADTKGGAAHAGRDPDVIRTLPGALIVVGDCVDEARQTRARLDSLVHADSAMASLSVALGHDASTLDPDAPLPETPESNASRGNRAHAVSLARREGLTATLASRLSARRAPSPTRWRIG